jgi:hypothetical protein
MEDNYPDMVTSHSIYLLVIKMKPRLILIFVILISSCTTETTGWRTLDFGAFKIKSPQGWTKFKEQGIDSYVGGLTNGRDSLWFDYGWYSAEIDDEDASNHLYAQDTINGLVATIQVPKIEGHGIIMLNITHVNEKDRFSFYGHDIAQTDTVLKMF